MTCDAYCEGCYYFGPAHRTCDYWEKADQLRGCPPGEGCTKKITKKEYKKMAAPKKWDKVVGFEMWKAGNLLCYMTKKCGTTDPDWFCADGERRTDHV